MRGYPGLALALLLATPCWPAHAVRLKAAVVAASLPRACPILSLKPAAAAAVQALPLPVARLSVAAPAAAPEPARFALWQADGQLAQAEQPEQRARALSRIFEAAVSPSSDGAVVAPSLVTPEMLLRQADLDAARDRLRRDVAKVQPALEKSVWRADWHTTLDDACCSDAAPKLGFLLRQQDQGVDVVESELHYYLMARLPFGEVILDPSIRQFFGGAKAPADVPRVFVGTLPELKALFSRHAHAYDLERIYFKDARVSNSRLERIARRVETAVPADPEHWVLRQPPPL